MKKHWKGCILVLLIISLFLIPLLCWGNLYIVGGDDARLYYIIPQLYLRNFSFNVITNNTLGGNLGYLPVSYYVPLLSIIYLLKIVLPYINTQLLAYGAILSLGFYFFYLFLQEWTDKNNSYIFLAEIVSSLSYVFSNYLTKTFYQHQQLSIYLILVVPGMLYLFTRGVKTKNMVFIILSALLYSICSSTVLSLPWFLPVLFTSLPLLLYFFWNHKEHFIRAAVIFVLITVCTNVYWIVHYIIPMVFKTSDGTFTGYVYSQAFRNQNHDLIEALASLNDPVNQMLSTVRTSWQNQPGMVVAQYLGIIYLGIILVAGATISKAKKSLRFLYIISFIGLVIAMLFVTPNFGQWNISLFELFNDRVPFFVMFRNMYDKFSLAIALQYAFALFISLVVIGETFKSSIVRYVCLIIIFALSMSRAVPYIFPQYNDAAYSTRISGQMNEDFIHLTSYIAGQHSPSRYVWLPLTFPGYVYIGDQLHPNHFYTGISPLQLFAGASDIAGFYGVQTSADPELNWKILELFKKHSYGTIVRILQDQNVRYVIVNHEQAPLQLYNMLNNYDLIAYQSKEYQQVLLGRKIRDFGTRYTLYNINDQFSSPTVFLTNTIQGSISDVHEVQFNKVRSGFYDVVLSASKSAELVLLEPYSGLWRLDLVSGTTIHPVKAVQDIAFNFGNAWEINPSQLFQRYPGLVEQKSNGIYLIHLHITFWPTSVTIPAGIISIVSMGIAVLACVWAWMLKRKRE